jgi:APA family basic amino acid/polyamine antiporter
MATSPRTDEPPVSGSHTIFSKKPLELLIQEMAGEHRLKRVLGPVALTSLGVGAIIGTGIFVLIGEAAHDKAGPAIMLSFVVAGIACVFAGLCYAEFASMVPVAGSAYTYAYATLGEVFAWIIGWDLVLEYAVSASAVAVGWSKYFQALLDLIGRVTGSTLVIPKVIAHAPFDYNPDAGAIQMTGAWFDLPAMLIVFALTVILVVGIKESANFNAAMVIVKLAVVLFVIVVGAFYVNPANWKPFSPYGWSGLSFFGQPLGRADAGGKPIGMMAGAAMIFFAYIGFDAVSTNSEEAKKPSRDVPIGILASLVVCTLLYIAVAAVLTGMVPYDQIHIDAPVSNAFAQHNLKFAEGLIAVGAITGITSVLLVNLLSQPRILLAMARDGLLPKSFFASVHPKFRTPWKSTILTGILVAILAGFLPLRILAELVSIGTLFAFVVVCAAVLVMRRLYPDTPRPFRAPLVPLTPILGIGICLVLMFSLPAENWLRLFGWLGLGLAIYFLYSRHHSVMASYTGYDLGKHGMINSLDSDVDPPPVELPPKD